MPMITNDRFANNQHDKLKLEDVSAAYPLLIMLVLVILFIIVKTPGPEPSFIIQDMKLNTFNVSATTSTLTSNLQITIFCQNNDLFTGIHFEKIDAYASYRNQQITPSTIIPPTYIGHPDATLWSPYLSGTEVAVDPYLAASLAQDLLAGAVLINFIVNGQLRSEGRFRTTRYKMEVNCPIYVMFQNMTDDVVFVPAVKPPFVEGCYSRLQV